MQKKSNDPLDLIACDNRYFWNLELLRDFINQGVDCRWFTPLIQGYVRFIEGIIGTIKVKICLIARRMHKRAGTKHIHRGIDD
jgi:hypothetical protein